MTDQTVHIRVSRATFVAEGHPDTEARVLIEPDGSISFSINFGDSSKAFIASVDTIPDKMLQFAEGLQFVTDTISAEVPGRLSPFVRGWTNVASDLVAAGHSTIRDDSAYPLHEYLDEREDDVATDILAHKLSEIMVYAHNRGLPLAKLIETKSKAGN